MKWPTLILFLFVLIWGIIFSYRKIFTVTEDFANRCGEYSKTEIKLGGKNIFADIANDECKKTLGLSGRNTLTDNQGMLFVFEKTGNYGFWMKEMNFPIDIIWLDENFKIVGLINSLTPDTYPEIFGQNFVAKYVLEVKANFSKESGLEVGKNISIDKK